MPGSWQEIDFDPQDRAETADETHFSDDGETFMTLEDIDGVFDATRADGDQDDEDFDEDAFGEDDLEEDDELDYRAAAGDEDDYADPALAEADDEAFMSDEIDGLENVRDAVEATGGEDDFSNFQSRNVSDEDLRRMGYADGER